MKYQVGDVLISSTQCGGLQKDGMYKVVYTDPANGIVRLHQVLGAPVPGSFTWGWLDKSVCKVSAI